MVVDHLVGVVPAVAHAVCDGQEVAFLDVAEGLGPGESAVDGVAPGVVVGILVVEVDGVVVEEEFVPGVGALVGADVRALEARLHGEGAAGTAAELVVVDEFGAEFPALAVGGLAVERAGDVLAEGALVERRVDAARVVLVVHHARTELEGVERVGIPLDAEVGAEVVALVVGVF